MVLTNNIAKRIYNVNSGHMSVLYKFYNPIISSIFSCIFSSENWLSICLMIWSMVWVSSILATFLSSTTCTNRCFAFSRRRCTRVHLLRSAGFAPHCSITFSSTWRPYQLITSRLHTANYIQRVRAPNVCADVTHTPRKGLLRKRCVYTTL